MIVHHVFEGIFHQIGILVVEWYASAVYDQAIYSDKEQYAVKNRSKEQQKNKHLNQRQQYFAFPVIESHEDSIMQKTRRKGLKLFIINNAVGLIVISNENVVPWDDGQISQSGFDQCL